MGICNWLCVNKSGQSYNLYDFTTNQYKGKIYNRESFVLTGGEGCLEGIYFLNSSGNTQILVVCIYHFVSYFLLLYLNYSFFNLYS